MENQAEFSVKPAIERTPFQDKITQAFFSKWCEVNDSSEPVYVSREEYEKQRDKGILQKQPEGKKSKLFIPEDLKLWEMIDVIEAVDKDTFAHDPKKKEQVLRTKRKEFNELSDMFVNAGIYMAKRAGSVREGKQTAEKTAKDLYRYGNALRTGNYDEQTDIEEIAGNSLSARQTEEIDNWFGVGKELEAVTYPHKSKDMDVREQMRQDMMKQLFKATEKAKEGSGPHRKAIEKVYSRYVEASMGQHQQKFEQELQDVIFRRGLEKLVNEMGKEGWKDAVVENFKTIGIDLEGQEKNLREVLEIQRLKEEFDAVRQTGDVAKISEKEREIALKIQNAVSRIPYDEDGDQPSRILDRQTIGCVGASMLGGQFLKEVGVNYLVGTLPGHSVTALITSDGKAYWQDFLNPRENAELTDEYIKDSYL